MQLNQIALKNTQGALLQHCHSLPQNLEWIYGRDGYLTARERGRWWSGCSLPMRAARRMLQTMEVPASIACFLNPAHAAQVRVVLEMLERWQGVIVLLPDVKAFQILLRCDDFSQELREHRLWFAVSERWQEELETLLEQNPGLPTPNQFIRPLAADSTFTDSLVAPAQSIFNAQSAKRAQLVQKEREQWTRCGDGKLLVVAPSHFRLWNDGGFVLSQTLSDELAKATARAAGNSFQIKSFDPDDPASASPVALIRALPGCDAIVTANIARADLPDIVPAEMPWITWATGAKMPAALGRCACDRLLVTDPQLLKAAHELGWPKECVSLAQWPGIGIEESSPRPVTGDAAAGTLVMLADTPLLDPPEKISEYSSHAILWDAIRDELLENPFAVGEVAAYLDNRRQQFQIPEENFDRVLFIENLILPAFAQGICRLLMKLKLPLLCAGKGWDRLEEFRPAAGGAVTSRQRLWEIAKSAAALICPVPGATSHPVYAMGRPILHAAGNQQSFIQDSRAALAARLPLPKPPTNPLRAVTITSCLD